MSAPRFDVSYVLQRSASIPKLATSHTCLCTVDSGNVVHASSDEVDPIWRPGKIVYFCSLCPDNRPGLYLHKRTSSFLISTCYSIQFETKNQILRPTYSSCLRRVLASLPPDPTSTAAPTSSNHEGSSNNRQLALRECSHILCRLSATWQRSIGYSWR